MTAVIVAVWLTTVGCSALLSGRGDNGSSALPSDSPSGDLLRTSGSAETIDKQAIVNTVLATVEARIAEQAAAATATAQTAPVVAVAAGMGLELQERLVQLYDDTNPSVVLIQVGGGLGLSGSGSGFVYDNDGHIVTNNHVVSGASLIEVVFADGSRSRARMVGTDADSDLAVIKVDTRPAEARPIPVASLDSVDVGQFVVAIGSPFGEQGSMTLGIISGLGRSLSSQRSDTTGATLGYRLPQVIQTDAPINPGNSGGPLLNLDGEVVGINSAIRTETGSNSGVGFAIPADAVTRIVPRLIENGRYVYPYMGVGLETLTIDAARRLGFERTEGAYVATVQPNSPAATAGLRPGNTPGRIGDLIIRIDDRTINSFDDLNTYLVFNTEVGQVINITVLRDGEEITLPLTLGPRP